MTRRQFVPTFLIMNSVVSTFSLRTNSLTASTKYENQSLSCYWIHKFVRLKVMMCLQSIHAIYCLVWFDVSNLHLLYNRWTLIFCPRIICLTLSPAELGNLWCWQLDLFRLLQHLKIPYYSDHFVSFSMMNCVL